MAIVHYKLEFQNSTSSGYYFVVYQECESSINIPWMIVGVPYAQSIPSSGHIEWKMEYGVTVIEEEGFTNSYHIGSVTLMAQLGEIYEVVLTDMLPQIKHIGTGQPEIIKIKNNTDQKLNLGVTLSHNLVAAQQTCGGVIAVFKTASTYHVGVFRHLQRDGFVPSNSSLPPITVNFPTGFNVALLATEEESGRQFISDPRYSYENYEKWAGFQE